MAGNKKLFRYYYWVILEFFKKHSRLILLSFFISFVAIIGFLSLSPYIKVAMTKQEVIGLVGQYDINNPPDEIVNKISNGLVTVTDKGEIIPVIANSWEVDPQGTRYRSISRTIFSGEIIKNLRAKTYLTISKTLR